MVKKIKIQRLHDEIEVPAPTKKPNLNTFWFLWRIWGFIWRKIKSVWNKAEYGKYDEEKNKFIFNPLYKRFKDYIWNGSKNSKLKKLLWKLDQQRRFGCPCCGDKRWIYLEAEHKDYFECTKSGTGNNPTTGKYYWWEGWRTCPRCGYKDWIHKESC